MVEDPKDHIDSDFVAALTALLREAEAKFLLVQGEYIDTKRKIDSLKRTIREYQQIPANDPAVATGPAERARTYLREMGKPCPIEEVLNHVHQQTAHYQLMNQGRVYIERSVTRACTGGTILYFTDGRIGLPAHASDELWKDQVDWDKIKEKGFTPHNKQRNKLKQLFPPEILKKLLSTTSK